MVDGPRALPLLYLELPLLLRQRSYAPPPHEQWDQKEYVRCYCCSFNARVPHRGSSHYHCDICSRSFTQVCRLRQHKDNTHARPPLEGELRLHGRPRMRNPFGRFSRRLDKKDVLPADISAKAKEEVRTALGISKCAIPDVDMIRSDKWRDIFNVETFGQTVGRSSNESCALILDSFPRLWILRCVPSSAMRDILREDDRSSTPRRSGASRMVLRFSYGLRIPTVSSLRVPGGAFCYLWRSDLTATACVSTSSQIRILIGSQRQSPVRNASRPYSRKHSTSSTTRYQC